MIGLRNPLKFPSTRSRETTDSFGGFSTTAQMGWLCAQQDIHGFWGSNKQQSQNEYQRNDKKDTDTHAGANRR
jgi:hypothetical protein